MNPLRVGLIGPLPPPSGGMANQAQQLAELLVKEGFEVEFVQTNTPYRPSWVGRIVAVRALFRLGFSLVRLWQIAGRVDLFHILANSGWSWHLFASPSIWIATLRKIPVIVNYHGGEAESFFKSSFRWIKPTLSRSSVIVVPSRFLQEIFSKYGVETIVVPNVIDLDQFSDSEKSKAHFDAPTVLVTRNLELIYDNATAIRAFYELRKQFPKAQLVIAGAGPEQQNLVELVTELGLTEVVTFTGRVEGKDMPALYTTAHIMINPSTVDNMPVSIIEALASHVPVVSTNVGGIPYFVEHEKSAMLVPAKDVKAMAEAIIRVLKEENLREQLIKNGQTLVQQFSWAQVGHRWSEIYQQASR